MTTMSFECHTVFMCLMSLHTPSFTCVFWFNLFKPTWLMCFTFPNLLTGFFLVFDSLLTACVYEPLFIPILKLWFWWRWVFSQSMESIWRYIVQNLTLYVYTLSGEFPCVLLLQLYPIIVFLSFFRLSFVFHFFTFDLLVATYWSNYKNSNFGEGGCVHNTWTAFQDT